MYILRTKGGNIMDSRKDLKENRKEIIANNLANIRISKNYTPTEIAKVLKKTRQAYNHYETGVRDISIYDLMTLSEFYGISVDKIVSNPINEDGTITLFYDHISEIDGTFKEVNDIAISTFHKDVILVTIEKNVVEYYVKNSTIISGSKTLFYYCDILYSSTIFEQSNGDFAFVDETSKKLINVSKDNRSKIIVLGIYGGVINMLINPSTF